MLMQMAFTALTRTLIGGRFIRIMINRALIYGALTAITLGVYGLVVGLLGALLGARGSFIISLVAAAVVAIAFGPLRDRLRRGVNHLMYGERDEPYQVISRLGQRLEAAFEPAGVLPAIVQTVGESLKLPYVAIGLTLDDWRPEPESRENLKESNLLGGNRSLIAASYGQSPHPHAPIINLSLTYQGETVGQLFITPRPGEASLSAADQRLLADLAQQAGVAVHGVRLMTDLHNLTLDLQCSRERLVLAREEERRRLRRDLHDDLAPTLAGLALTTATIADIIPTDPAKALSLATSLNQSMRTTVSNIRRLVYDLRPPALDELGLVAAIEERAAQFNNFSGSAPSLQVRVEADKSLPPLPAAVEVAAYRITQEALMNVARHAQARHCLIRLAAHNEITAGRRAALSTLVLEIMDNGVGLTQSHTPGVGLRSMKERAAELGGVCTIERRAQGGTRVFVNLPILREESDAAPSYPYRG